MAHTLLINMGIIVIFTYSALKLANAGKILYNEASTVSRTSRDTEDVKLIELKNLRAPFLIDQSEIINDTCQHMCEAIEIQAKIANDSKPAKYNGLRSKTCSGWLDRCLGVSGSGGATGKFCSADDEVIWMISPGGKKYGSNSGTCAIADFPKPRKLDDNYCRTCLCMCTEGSEDKPHANWAFNLLPRISDIDNNGIVVGVRFQTQNNIIWLEIKERQLGSLDEGSWKIVNGTSVSERHIDYSPLTPQNRAIQIGNITLPTDYVVTGVKFSKASPTLAGQNSLLRLEVQGTQVDLIHHKLVSGSSTWYNSDDAGRFTNAVPSSITFEDIGFTSGGELHITPFIALSDVQSEHNQPLSGTGLIVTTKNHAVKYLIPGVILSSIRNELATTTMMSETTMEYSDELMPEATEVKTKKIEAQTHGIFNEESRKVVDKSCSGWGCVNTSIRYSWEGPRLPIMTLENSGTTFEVAMNTFCMILITLVISMLRDSIY